MAAIKYINIMSNSSGDAIDSQPDYLPSVFNSFEQCNNALYEVNGLSLVQYFEITNSIPWDTHMLRGNTNREKTWLQSVLSLFLRCAKYNIRAFKIQLLELETIGFDISAYSSKMPYLLQSIINKHDDRLKKEKRFLAKHKLVEFDDYIMQTTEAEGEEICLGHLITRWTLYKIVANRYGSAFMNAIVSRICEILYFYDDYVAVNSNKRITQLHANIDNLTKTIESMKEQSVRPLIVTLDDYAQEQSSADPYQRYSKYCDSSYQSHSAITSDNVMKDREYSDEIYSIHQMIETNISKVDSRISELHNKLSNITSKIDDIVGTIAMPNRDSSMSSSYATEDSRLAIDYNDTYEDYRASYQICSSEPDRDSSEPILSHINGILHAYNEINLDTHRYSIHTPPVSPAHKKSMQL